MDKKATKDLQRYFDFLCELQEREQARSSIQAIADKVEILETQPKVGQEENFLRHLKRNYRRLVEGNYKIIYSFRKDKIYIHCIFDSRQNPKKMKVK